MSHFPGLVIVPSNLSLEEVLAPYNEDQIVPRHIVATRAEVIAKGRADIERYRSTTYAEYLADPDAYADKVTATSHLEYLRDEFPKHLTWTDDEVHADEVQWDEPEDLDSDGNLYSTGPVAARWDWYQVGGRWAGEWGADTFQSTTVALAALTGRLQLPDAYAPRSIVTPDKGWVERGRMGWFGMSNDEHTADDWRALFLAALADASTSFPSARAHVVDFHI